MSRGVRAPPTPAALVGALGSAREDLRRHVICGPSGHGRVSGAHDGDGGRADGEGASGAWDGHAAWSARWEGHGAASDERTVRKRSGRMSGHVASGAGRIHGCANGDLFFLFVREIGHVPAKARQDVSHAREISLSYKV